MLHLPELHGVAQIWSKTKLLDSTGEIFSLFPGVSSSFLVKWSKSELCWSDRTPASGLCEPWRPLLVSKYCALAHHKNCQDVDLPVEPFRNIGQWHRSMTSVNLACPNPTVLLFFFSMGLFMIWSMICVISLSLPRLTQHIYSSLQCFFSSLRLATCNTPGGFGPADLRLFSKAWGKKPSRFLPVVFGVLDRQSLWALAGMHMGGPKWEAYLVLVLAKIYKNH